MIDAHRVRSPSVYAHVIIGVDGRPGGKDAPALGGTLTDSDAAPTLVYVSQMCSPADQPTHLALELADAGSLAAVLEQERERCGGHPRTMRISARHAQSPLLIAPLSDEAGVRRRRALARVAV
jgi:hypothetical protein